MATDFAIESLSEDTLLLRFGEAVDMVTNARVHAAARALRAAGVPDLVDIAPAYASLMLRFDPDFRTRDDLPPEPVQQRLGETVRSVLANAGKVDPGVRRNGGRTTSNSDDGAAQPIEIPVCYGGGHGPDLATVAGHAQLTPEEVIVRHAGAVYTVAMLGFAPGFPYLLGLDPALATPRRGNPRTRVPAGSVAIGGAQTGIYPGQLPGGWWLIGRTPRVLFDPLRDPPCLVSPGERVRFRPIDAEEFGRLTQAAR